MREISEEEYYRHTMIVWRCQTPGCNFTYTAPPDCNEHGECPMCGAQCRKAGEEYP